MNKGVIDFPTKQPEWFDFVPIISQSSTRVPLRTDSFMQYAIDGSTAYVQGYFLTQENGTSAQPIEMRLPPQLLPSTINIGFATPVGTAVIINQGSYFHMGRAYFLSKSDPVVRVAAYNDYVATGVGGGVNAAWQMQSAGADGMGYHMMYALA